MRVAATAILSILSGAWGCASTGAGLYIRARDIPNGPVRFEGPLAGPYDAYGELAETACEHMSSQPATPDGKPQLGYCALFFHSPEDRAWFISYISKMEGDPRGPERSCMVPEDLLEPGAQEQLWLGGIYTGSTIDDEHVQEHWRPTLFLNQRTRRSWERDVMVFSLETPGQCTVYAYNGFSRDVTIRRDDKWVPVGVVYNEQGLIQALKQVD